MWRYAGIFVAIVCVGMLAFAGCEGSSEGDHGDQGPAGEGGVQGPTGEQGKDGTNCTVTDNGDGTITIACEDGTVVTVESGAAGKDGVDGTDGSPGDNGISCTVTPNEDGTKTISCTDGTSVIIKDGDDGVDVSVEDLHGEDFLLSSGEFAEPINPKRFVNAKIDSVTATTAGVLTVNFTVTDENDDPVTDVAGMSAAIAKLVPAANFDPDHWQSYIYNVETAGGGDTEEWNGAPWNTLSTATENQAYREGTSEYFATQGTFTNHNDGTYTYVFGTDLSSVTTPIEVTYDRTLTHRVAVFLGGHSGPTADAYLDFRPDGAAVSATRNIVETASCLRCHGSEFHGHGGDILQVESCVTCHDNNSYDAQSGESLEFGNMIHKIHAGGELDSMPGADGILWDNPGTVDDESADNGQYVLWGYNSSRNTWWKAGFPAILDNCQKCHTGSGDQVDNWLEVPTRAACGACHDDVDFATGANHPAPGGAQSHDGFCSSCHGPSGTWPTEEAHDFMNNDARNLAEYVPEMEIANLPTHTKSDPYGAGDYFAPGDPAPIIRIRLRDNEALGKPYLTGLGTDVFLADDGVTAVPPGDGPESCACGNGVSPNDTDPECTAGELCDEDKDGKFTTSNFYAYGPRASAKPALTYKARAIMRSTLPGPFSFAVSTSTYSYTAALSLIIDSGRTVYGENPTGGDIAYSGTVSVPIFQSGASGQVVNGGATSTVFKDASQEALIDSTGEASWRDNQYAGYWITFTNNSVPGASKINSQILTNVGSTITLTAANSTLAAWTAADNIVTYAMNAVSGTYSGQADTTGTDTTLTDTTAATWKTDMFKGFYLTVISGTGSISSAVVTGNTEDTITVASPLSAATNATSVYMLTPISCSSRTPDTSSVSTDELITLFNAVPAFKARAIAYKETNYLSATLSPNINYSNDTVINIGDTQIKVTSGTTIVGPTSGTLLLDSGTVSEEIVNYASFSSSTFTLTGTSYVTGTASAAISAGASSFSVSSNTGGKFPSAGNVIIDEGLGTEETIAYTRAGDAFTLTGTTTYAHASGAIVRVNLTGMVTKQHAAKGTMRMLGTGIAPTTATTTLPTSTIYFSVSAGTGIQYPASGDLIIDRLLTPAGTLNTNVSETVTYTRTGDVFKITTPAGGTTLTHSTSGTLFFTVANAFTIRSRNLGTFYSVQAQASTLTTIPSNLSSTNLVFPGEALGAYPVHVLGSSTPGATTTTGTASTVGNALSKQTDPIKDDPLRTFDSDSTSEYIQYQLDPVDDLLPGTYFAKIEFHDRGSLLSPDIYKTSTVARIKFNVKTGDEELPPVSNCGSCHTSGEDDPAKQNMGGLDDYQDGVQMKGFILDPLRHHKIFNNTADDMCDACHDYMPQTSSASTGWTGAVPNSRRVHAIHNGANLNYPLATVAYSNGDPVQGRNWDITLPMNVRSCDVACHPASGSNKTSGTWKTNPNRLACGGCHDSDFAQAHLRAVTYDPTPTAPFSGDEAESCATCH